MKKKFFSCVFILFILFLLFNMFFHSIDINNIILFAMETFITNIFPSLFPMFILANILSSIGLPEFLGSIFSKIMTKLFNVKGIASFVFFMSMISGFPSNAKYIKDLLDKKLIDEVDANKILIFTFFSNPLFVINTVGLMFFNNIKIGLLMLISHILGNIIVGLLFRNLFNKKEITLENINIKKSFKVLHNKINNTNIFKSFLNNINSSLLVLLNIFGIITCFLILNQIINANIKLNPLSNGILTGLLEFSTGLKSISMANIDFNFKIYLSMFFISFGGFSVHAQIINILEDYKINYYVFFLSRVIHGLISILLLFLFINL